MATRPIEVATGFPGHWRIHSRSVKHKGVNGQSFAGFGIIVKSKLEVKASGFLVAFPSQFWGSFEEVT